MKILSKPAVQSLSPYSSPRDAYPKAGIFLDANENALGSTLPFAGVKLNRYPDPDANELRSELARYCKVSTEQVLVGNGSDEIISLAINTFAGSGDNVVVIEPDFSMYSICAQVAGVESRAVVLAPDFSLDLPRILSAVDANTKLIIFSSPGSAFGNSIKIEQIVALLENFNGLVFVDEAYFEFNGETALSLLEKFDNLLISRTLSKAWGLAALRIGYCIASIDVINSMRKVKLPYNVGAVNQYLAVRGLKNGQKMEEMVAELRALRGELARGLALLGFQVFPSVTNFIVAKLTPCVNSRQVQENLAQRGIIVRDRSSLPLMQNCIRIAVGTRDENEQLIAALRQVIGQ